jgi:predicted lipid-binding transport protein (Tim44 family)
MKNRGYASLFLIIASLAIVAYPEGAEARAGGGKSIGSRGTHTYQSVPNTGASTINRSATTSPGTAPANPVSSAPLPPNTGGGFMRGLAGGIMGASLAHMLFGGMGGGGGGGLLQLLIIGGIGYYIYKRFKGRGYSSGVSSIITPAPNTVIPFAGNMPSASQPLTVTDGDKSTYEQLLINIQHAWSEGDLSKLRQYVTPEMLQYFSEELSANASRNLANKVEQVQLQDADITESWQEYGIDYTTARMRWTALDYMVRLDKQSTDADYIESGSKTQVEPAEEVWTFMRASGGHWLLSAIQQNP